jgi:hypothetical protein
LRRVWELLGDERYTIPLIVVILLFSIVVAGYVMQSLVERNSLPPIDSSVPKKEYEIAKLAAEIRQIRSDTSGSLFWLKTVALLVTVGGAVGGYLIGQSRTTERRIAHEMQAAENRLKFEDRQNIDAQYQALVQELSSENAPVLRAAAAVKLGDVMKSFPPEWKWAITGDRQNQLIELTKKVLAAALAIENDEKVLKTLTSALALHKPWENRKKGRANLRDIDLSGAKASDAYWAKVDFFRADFYQADVTEASFKGASLYGAQLRETDLRDAVLIEANCTKANFKLADLRGADLTRAKLRGTIFEGAKVHDTKVTNAYVEDIPETKVDLSEAADHTKLVTVQEWLSQHGAKAMLHRQQTERSS